MRTYKIVDFAVQAGHRIKLKEWEKKDKYIEFTRGLENIVEHEGDNYTKRHCCFRYSD